MNKTQQHIDPILIPILEQVSDPEIPVLSIMDMGVVRSAVIENNSVKVQITPTYSGCPAMDVIGEDINKAMEENGYKSKVELVLSPAWTTDWITEKGRNALAKYGIANCLKDNDGSSRPFSFIALGGSSNGSTLEGHNYTYVGSTYGKIVDILIALEDDIKIIDSKTQNPILNIFFDESKESIKKIFII